MIQNATANVPYTLQTQYRGNTVESETFDADELLDNYTHSLAPAVLENTTDQVRVVVTTANATLASGDISYIPTLSRDELNDRIDQLAPTEVEVTETGDRCNI